MAARTTALTVVSQRRLGISEASAVASLSGGVFLVVDDEAGIFATTVDGQPYLLAHDSELADLEGVCVTPAEDVAYVLSEKKGHVFQFAVKRDDDAITLGERNELGQLARLGKDAGRGWEGIAFAAGAAWPDGADRLLAVHQGKPRRVGVFSLPGLELEAELRLPKDAKRALSGLSDIAISPRSGHWLLLSGRAGLIAEVERRGEPGAWELGTLAFYRVPAKKSDVPEGLVFDARGRLWMVTDGKGRLIELAGL